MPASLLALLDDIASVLDDVSILTKVAAKKTAGVLGDDLALNAQQVTGMSADRELPVVWAVAKGSVVNKAILVPVALGLSALAPWSVTPLLMLGGAFLCFEGVEKVVHALSGHAGHHDAAHAPAAAPPGSASPGAVAAPSGAPLDVAALEKEKIRGAVRTDFVLSAEIVTIALGTVSDAPFGTRVLVLCGLSALMTVGVYGLVAGIVKLDDAGLHLSQRRGPDTAARLARRLGRAILALAPYLMKALSIVGTAAMFLVGGGILAHGIAPLAALLHVLEERAAHVPVLGGVLHALVPLLLNGVVGLVLGGLVLLGVSLVRRLLAARRPA
jgi:predicted DNA repair protein MutK